MSNIGINVVEVDGRATPSIQAAPTSVAAFIIRSQRGVPEDAVYQVTNWSQFTEHFGSYMDNAYGAYAVRGFFDNGGSVAYVTRVVKAPGKETAASVKSGKKATWNLAQGGTLMIETDQGGPYSVEFQAESHAELGALETPPEGFDILDKNVILRVDGHDPVTHRFTQSDFAGQAATAAEVTAVLNREFTGIQAWVEDGNLKLRTDSAGTASSLQVSGAAADVLFGEQPRLARGSGNIVQLGAVRAEEAVEAMRFYLNEAPLDVTADGEVVTITHKDKGEAHWIQIQEGDVQTAFGFDTEEHRGTGQSMEGVATPASCSLDGGKLLITAGYRGKEDPGAWGNNLAIRIVPNLEKDGTSKTYTLFVRYNGNVVETWEKLNANGAADKKGQHPTIINDEFTGSKYIVVSPQGAENPPQTDDPAQPNVKVFVNLQNGQEDDLTGTDLQNALIATLPRFDIHEVQLVCCPESCEQEWVTQALTYCANRGDCMFIGHTPQVPDVAAAKEYGNDFQAAKVYGALYFPWIQVADPIGTRKWIPPTGHVLGVYARTERERGIWKAPAGNAALVNGALDVRCHFNDADHTDLVKNGSVNAVRFIPGQGIVIDSSRTLSTSTLWLYVNVRLLFNFVESS
ncbi:MAG: phage tail sheath subtilisin-like domain-containing protein, partial [Anaerolineae bacterium]